MQPLTRQRLAANAYRTLGLSASADQAAVDGAARRMRIWPDPSRIPPTPWDLPWFEPVARAKDQIEQAVAQLGNPGPRIEEQLLWYLGTAPPPQTLPQCAQVLESRTAAADVLARHDAALASLHLAYASDKLDISLWRRVIEQWDELSKSAELIAAIEQIQLAGNFDKPASASEIAAAASAIPAALADALVPRAHAALDQGDEKTCAAMLSLLGRSEGQEQSPTALGDLLDRLEDTLAVHFREMEEDLRKKLLTNHSAPQGYYDLNNVNARLAQIYYNEKIVPNLRRFWPLAANDPNRLLRMRGRCAMVLELLALGWEWAAQFTLAEQTLGAALELGEGLPISSRLRETLVRIKPLAAREKAGKKPLRPKGARRLAANGKQGAGMIAVAVLVAIVRAIAAFNSASHPPARTPAHNPLDFQRQVNNAPPLVLARPTTRPAMAEVKDEPWQSTGETNREQ